MRFLCEAYTGGGPVAIIPFEHRHLWDGAADYFEATGTPRNSCLQFISKFKNACNLCIFHQESDGNFHVFYDSFTLLIAGEISADEGFELRHHIPAIPKAIKNVQPVIMNHFGGKVVIFDAAVAGQSLTLREAGCEEVGFGANGGKQRHDAALVEIEIGAWQAFELFLEEDHLSFNGVLFQLLR